MTILPRDTKIYLEKFTTYEQMQAECK